MSARRTRCLRWWSGGHEQMLAWWLHLATVTGWAAVAAKVCGQLPTKAATQYCCAARLYPREDPIGRCGLPLRLSVPSVWWPVPDCAPWLVVERQLEQPKAASVVQLSQTNPSPPSPSTPSIPTPPDLRLRLAAPAVEMAGEACHGASQYSGHSCKRNGGFRCGQKARSETADR